MKKTLKLLTIVLPLFLLACIARADELATNDSYRASEFSLEGFYTTSTPDFEAETGSAGVGLNYFLTRNFGIGVSTAVGNLNGPLIDSVSLRGIYRVPIEKTALYGYGGSTRLIKREEWTIDLGIGVEHRFTPNIGPFIEAGMVKLLKHSAEATGRVGLRVSF